MTRNEIRSWKSQTRTKPLSSLSLSVWRRFVIRALGARTSLFVRVIRRVARTSWHPKMCEAFAWTVSTACRSAHHVYGFCVTTSAGHQRGFGSVSTRTKSRMSKLKFISCHRGSVSVLIHSQPSICWLVVFA